MIRIAVDLIVRPWRFRPTIRFEHFSQIDQLVGQGQIKLVLTDKDDTISGYRQFQIYDQRIRSSLIKLQQVNIPVKILSNGIKEGDPNNVQGLQILKTYKKKPFNGDELKTVIGSTDINKVWIIGDRLMTDIYLANLIGCSSILVKPLQPSTINRHGLAVYFLRKVQNLYLSLHSY